MEQELPVIFGSKLAVTAIVQVQNKCISAGRLNSNFSLQYNGESEAL